MYHAISQFLLNGVVHWLSCVTQGIQVWASSVICISNKVAHCITDLHRHFPSVFLRIMVMQRKSGENTGFKSIYNKTAVKRVWMRVFQGYYWLRCVTQGIQV